MKLTLVLLLSTLACCCSSASALCDVLERIRSLMFYGSTLDVEHAFENHPSLVKPTVLKIKACIDEWSEAEKDGTNIKYMLSSPGVLGC